MTSGVEFWLCVWRAVLGLSSLEGSLIISLESL